MANHKRKRPPSSRSGCAMCKPWKKGKVQGEANLNRFSQYKKMRQADDQIRDAA